MSGKSIEGLVDYNINMKKQDKTQMKVTIDILTRENNRLSLDK